jgi:hypothetical protein
VYNQIIAEYTHMLRPNKKRLKGEPIDWEQLKDRHNVNLTLTAWNGLEKLGAEMGGVSRSEAIERLVREKL